MKMILLAVFVAVTVSACGGQSPTTPTAPAPIPAAQIVSLGGGTFTSCNIISCFVTFPMQNQGVGCASGIAGTVTFSNASGPLGAEQWTHTPTVRANESFVVSRTVAVGFNAATSYRMDPAWTNVRC